ncbi:putative cytochrome P450 127A1 [Frankia canadensis]|uniref:Putative cytochrome P450 127A1 n=1 Tax=Frankia canadensis TaxID=1836972 RepID=A0A2I2KUH6_9ACTN|nr:cytochrome P450 [Frankia canadensis]SNQ49327.1 putative cytochrome P450 127A1 [Frankia canadensis]SOU56617.1 putative cytochrome P450 127A1 [Frankia canadensis]
MSTDTVSSTDAEARARAAGVPVIDFDPECDPRFKDDPLGTILAGQQVGDIFYSTAARGFWVITRHELFREISQATDRYSNRETFTFYRDPPDVFQMPANLDPPDHTKVRRLLMPLLSPAAVKRLESRARASVARIADEVAERGSCDFMADVALRIPAEVFLEHMGLPLSRADEIIATRLLPGKLNASNDPGGVQLKAAVAAVRAMFEEVLAERRRQPADDIPTYLLSQELDGRPLTDQEILQLCHTLLGTSLGTTASTMAFLFKRLAEDPALRHSATSTPEMVGGLVDEALRNFPAIPLLARTVRADVDFHGIPWKEGDRLLLLLAAANADQDAFPSPEQFDPQRTPNRHVAFGLGPHRCAGAHLAGMELRVLVEEWHRRIPDYHLGDLSDLTHEVSVAVRMTTLPLVIDSPAPSFS